MTSVVSSKYRLDGLVVSHTVRNLLDNSLIVSQPTAESNILPAEIRS